MYYMKDCVFLCVRLHFTTYRYFSRFYHVYLASFLFPNWIISEKNANKITLIKYVVYKTNIK